MNNGNLAAIVRTLIPAVLLASMLAAGCGGGDYSSVKGKVTLDGQPLPDALVRFSPVNPGSPSYGRTDADGQYELIYTRDAKGAEVGEHVVSITTAKPGDPDGDPPTEDVPEKLPAKYHAQSELKREVMPGRNVIDFDLQGQ
jgi:hypothetical protein